MSDLKFERINEYIFAPFNTFIYLDDDEMLFADIDLRQTLIERLNKESMPLPIKNSIFKIKWATEDSEEFKLSKGVFIPPGKENSFIMAQLVGETPEDSFVTIKEEVSNFFPANSVKFRNVRFYFHEGGVGTASVLVELEKTDGLTILQLEKVSETVNALFKEYFEDVCFQISQQYIHAIRTLDIPHHQFDFLPDINEVEKAANFIPWTHRIYHIQDDSLFQLENPGEPFKFLLTPSRKMDIQDLSIYDNRYIYFGWGHSIIFTASQEDGYSQTSKPVYDYVRLVEIAQAKWQFLDVLTDIVVYALASFNKLYKTMHMKDISNAITEIRNFENAIDRMLVYFRGVKITFDTENRVLLKELHDRWLTDQMLETLQSRLRLSEELLDQLHQRQKEQREESLNTIVLLFTIIGIVDIFGVIFDVLNLSAFLDPVFQFIILVLGTLTLALIIVLYLQYAQRG
ncbi:MAG: hypothetical protein ACFFDI_16495 [Promethearchaeota archaeon]